MVRIVFSSLFLLLVLNGSLIAAEAGQANIPNTLRALDDLDGPPTWVSENELHKSISGKASSDRDVFSPIRPLFSNSGWVLLNQTLDRSEESSEEHSFEKCTATGISRPPHAVASDIANLVELSHSVAIVRISGSKQGFFSGNPGELLELEVTAILKESDNSILHQTFYLFNDFARMRIAGRDICIGFGDSPRGEYYLFLASEESWSELPAYFLGENLLVSTKGNAASLHGRLFQPRATLDSETFESQLNSALADLTRDGAVP